VASLLADAEVNPVQAAQCQPVFPSPRRRDDVPDVIEVNTGVVHVSRFCTQAERVRNYLNQAMTAHQMVCEV